MTNLDLIVEQLHTAQATGRTLRRWTPGTPLSLEAAYDVQRRLVARLVTAEAAVVGLKLGFTSEAKARQMGVDEPIAGVLTAPMALPHDGHAAADRFVQPRIEPELAFQIDTASGEILGVAAGLEVIDSRYVDFDFGPADVVADNASAAGFVVGPWADPTPELLASLADAAATFSEDGAVLTRSSTAEILGDPLGAVEVARRLADRLAPLPGVAVLLAGAFAAAVPFRPGHRYETAIEGLPTAAVSTLA